MAAILQLYQLSRGHIAGLSVELIEVTCSVKVFHWITGSSLTTLSPMAFSQSIWIYIKNKSTYLLNFGGIIFEALDYELQSNLGPL